MIFRETIRGFKKVSLMTRWLICSLFDTVGLNEYKSTKDPRTKLLSTLALNPRRNPSTNMQNVALISTTQARLRLVLDVKLNQKVDLRNKRGEKCDSHVRESSIFDESSGGFSVTHGD
jgi:hypothetical protein